MGFWSEVKRLKFTQKKGETFEEAITRSYDEFSSTYACTCDDHADEYCHCIGCCSCECHEDSLTSFEEFRAKVYEEFAEEFEEVMLS